MNERQGVPTRACLSVLLLLGCCCASPPIGRTQEPPFPTGGASATGRIYRGPDGTVLPFRSQDEVLEFLRRARPVEIRQVGEASLTRPRRVLLEDGGVRAHAIFHDIDIHLPRARVDGEVVEDFRDSYRLQAAAFELGRLLGMDNVVPGVVRKLRGGTGCASLWIEDAMDWNHWLNNRPTLAPLHPELDLAWELRRQLVFHDMRVFDNLIDNLDRNQNNILIGPDGEIWLIDHTRTFGSRRDLPAPEKVQRCSRELLSALRSVPRRQVRKTLSPYLDMTSLQALSARWNRLVEILETRIEARGADEILFDRPAAPGRED